MRQNSRVRNSRYILCLLALAALALAGCGDSGSTGNPEVDARSDMDTAYEAVAAAQIANAVGYSEAILKSSNDADVKKFAQQVLDERAGQQQQLDRFRKTGEPVDVKKASHELNISLADLAITADGKPLAAPSSDSAYLKAMKANLNGSIKAAEVEMKGGGPGTTQLANRVYSSASAELEQLKQLQS